MGSEEFGNYTEFDLIGEQNVGLAFTRRLDFRWASHGNDSYSRIVGNETMVNVAGSIW